MGKVSLSIPQSEAYYSGAKSTAVVAGFGSGKTHAALTKAFDLLLEYPGVPVGYAAPTYGLIKDIWYPQIEAHCNDHGFKYDIHKSDHVVNVKGLGNIVCRSLSNPDKIVGFEVGDFLLDELDILPMEQALNAWRKCKARCRIKFPKRRLKIPGGRTKKKLRKTNQMYVYTTPEGFKATHQLFAKDPLPKSRLIQMSTYSNIKNLPDDYIEELMANYPPQLIAAYIEGKFVNLTSGSVYPAFDRDLNNAIVFPRVGEPLFIGMDFNVGNMSAVVHVIRHGRPCAVGELVEILDTPAMIKTIREVYPKHIIVVYPDASGAARKTVNASTSDLKLLTDEGFQVRVNYSNPAVKDRINSMNAMFCNIRGERRYYVNVAKVPKFVDSLEQQAFDKNGQPDKQNGWDHLPDGAGYYIENEFGIAKPSSQTGRLIM